MKDFFFLFLFFFFLEKENVNELITKKSTNSCFRKKINGYTTQYLLFIPKWVFGWFKKKKVGFWLIIIMKIWRK